jgi:hypothetical protein
MPTQASAQLRQSIQSRLADQRLVVRQLLALREQLQGSLIERYGVCGKPGCACGEGRKHGPYYVLSTRSRGKGGFTYLDAKQASRARRLVRRHRDFRAGLKRLKQLNEELVALLKHYQSLGSRDGSERLGIRETA